jgi:hypothetical protein
MSVHRTPISDERLVLAFYGVDPSPKVSEDFFLTVGEWFAELGYSPDALGVVGAGHSGKVGDYRRTKAKLEKVGFSNVESLSVRVSDPSKTIPWMEYLASACFSHAGDDGGYAIVAAPSSLATKDLWLPVAHKLIRGVRPAYGIGFKRELHLGPVMYAMGVCQGLGVGLTGDAYEQARNISRWSDLGMVEEVYREGLLRDVYPWNFLTQPQLTKPVGGVPLEHWIRRDTTWGILSPLRGGVFLWEVDEAHVPAVQLALHQAGAIFDWRKYP